jgi:hypothetical protein
MNYAGITRKSWNVAMRLITRMAKHDCEVSPSKDEYKSINAA